MKTLRIQFRIIWLFTLLALCLGVPPAESQDLPYRAVVGLQQAGASSAKSVQRFFMDLNFDHPINTTGKIGYRIWGGARISTVPQQIDSTVRDFARTFLDQVTDVKVNEVAQSGEFNAGIELFHQFNDGFGLGIITSFGAITPITPRETVEVFQVAPQAIARYPSLAGNDYVAFVSPDRDRFFRRYAGGLRIHYYTKQNSTDSTRIASTLDITFGGNESVTGGRLRGGVFQLEGFYPLAQKNNHDYVYVFGTAAMKFSRTKITDPLLLNGAPANTPVPGPNVAIVTIPTTNRDQYRVGIGVNLAEVVHHLFPSRQ